MRHFYWNQIAFAVSLKRIWIDSWFFLLLLFLMVLPATGSCKLDAGLQEDPDTMTVECTEKASQLIWIMNLGEFRANRTGREGQAINNLPCRGSLQITGPPLCLLVFCHSSFSPLLSVTYLLSLLFSFPSFFAFRSVTVRRSGFQTDRQTLGEVLRVEAKHVFIYFSPPVFDTHLHSWGW